MNQHDTAFASIDRVFPKRQPCPIAGRELTRCRPVRIVEAFEWIVDAQQWRDIVWASKYDGESDSADNDKKYYANDGQWFHLCAFENGGAETPYSINGGKRRLCATERMFRGAKCQFCDANCWSLTSGMHFEKLNDRNGEEKTMAGNSRKLAFQKFARSGHSNDSQPTLMPTAIFVQP